MNKLLVAIVFLFCFGQLSAKGKYLIPYRQGNYWGMSDENGIMVVPCKYVSVARVSEFIVATPVQPGPTAIIMDLSGHIIDSCTGGIVPINSDTLLVLNRSAKVANDLLFTFKEPPRGMNAPKEPPATVYWQTFAPQNVHLRAANGKARKVDGTVYAMVSGTTLAAIELGDKCGMQWLEDSFAIPAVYDSMRFIKPDMLLAYKDGTSSLFDVFGQSYPFTPPANAIYIDKRNGNYITLEKLKPTNDNNFAYSGHKLWNKEGKELISPERSWDYQEHTAKPMHIILRKPKAQLVYGQSGFQIADINGQPMLPSMQEAAMIGDSFLKVTDIGPGKRKQYIYSIARSQIVYTDSTGTQTIGESNSLLDIKKDGIHSFYDNHFNVIATIADSAMHRYRAPQLVQTLNIYDYDSAYRATGISKHTYIAIRAKSNEHYTIYDEHLNSINTDYEELYNMHEARTASFRKNGKWGLLNYMFKEIVPPIYDTVIYDNRTFAVASLNKVKKRIDLKTFKVIDLDRYSYFDPEGLNGKHIALRYFPVDERRHYAQYRRVQAVFTANDDGAISDSMVVNDEREYKYAFSGTGKIVKYPTGDDERAEGVFVMDKLNGSLKKCPYPAGGVELCFGKAVLVQCVNEKRQLGMLNVDNFGVVVPFGKYDFMFIYPEKIATAKGQPMEVVEIKGGTEKWHKESVSDDNPLNMLQGKQPRPDRESVGYYSLWGKKYWDKLPAGRK